MIHTTDREWHDLQCHCAKASRKTFDREITNRKLTLGEVLRLLNKHNATPLDRMPVTQVRLTSVKFGPTFATGDLAFIATLEYSPLGWPELTGTPNDRPTCIVSPADPTRTFGAAERARLEQMLREARGHGSCRVIVADSAVTVTPIPPSLSTADLNALFANSTEWDDR